MQLSTYFKTHGISYPKFARALSVSPITVYRWVKGYRFPVRHLAQISEATNGLVTANDFVSVPRRTSAPRRNA